MEQKKSTFKKISSISLNTLFYLFIAVLLVFSVANIQVKKENDIANVFGLGFLSVQSNSMYGDLEDSFEKGDIVLVNMLDEDSVRDLEIGDIVTYYDMTISAFNTHRIVDIDYDQEFIITQADYNPSAENTNTHPDRPISFDQAIATYQTTVSGLGNTLDYLQSPTGFAVAIILPVILILAFEGIMLGRNILQMNRSKMAEAFEQEKADQEKLLEAEKEKLRQEILEELKQQK